MPSPTLIRKMKKKSRQSSGWTPAQLSNVWAWYRSDQGVFIATGVLQWADILGSGRDLSQGAGIQQPTFTPGVINGHATIDFDGVDDFLITPFAVLSQPTTIFAVLRQNVWGPATNRFWDGRGAINTGGVFQFGVTPNIIQYAGNFGGSSPELAVGAFGLITNIFNSTLSSIQVNDGIVFPGDAGTNNMDGVTLGESGSPGGGLASNISVAEMIVMSALATPAEIQQVKNYVATRYAIVM